MEIIIIIIVIIFLLIILEKIGNKRLRETKEQEYKWLISDYEEMNSDTKITLNKISIAMHNHRREDLDIFLKERSISYDLYVMLNNIFDLYDKVNDERTTREEMVEIAHMLEGKIMYNGILFLIDLPDTYSVESNDMIPELCEPHYFTKEAALDAKYYQMELYNLKYIQFYCSSCNKEITFGKTGYICMNCGKEVLKVSFFRKLYIKYVKSVLKVFYIFLKIIDFFL